MAQRQSSTAGKARPSKAGEPDPERAFRVVGFVLSVMIAPFARFELPPIDRRPTDQPVLWAPNHRSMFDIAVGLIGLHRMGYAASFFVNVRYFEVPVLGWALRTIGAVPIDVTGSGVQAIARGVDCLRSGRSLVIMAEGRLVPPAERSGGIGELAAGVGVLARRARLPVVPVALVGSDDILPIGGRVPRIRLGRRHVILVRFGEPVAMTGKARDAMARLENRLSTLMIAADDEHRDIAP